MIIGVDRGCLQSNPCQHKCTHADGRVTLEFGPTIWEDLVHNNNSTVDLSVLHHLFTNHGNTPVSRDYFARSVKGRPYLPDSVRVRQRGEQVHISPTRQRILAAVPVNCRFLPCMADLPLKLPDEGLTNIVSVKRLTGDQESVTMTVGGNIHIQLSFHFNQTCPVNMSALRGETISTTAPGTYLIALQTSSFPERQHIGMQGVFSHLSHITCGHKYAGDTSLTHGWIYTLDRTAQMIVDEDTHIPLRFLGRGPWYRWNFCGGKETIGQHVHSVTITDPEARMVLQTLNAFTRE